MSRINDFPLIAIGTSAGGLAALEAFFSGIPENMDTDMAFVLVQHLDPDQKNILSDIITSYTKMKIVEISEKSVLKPSSVYIAPPGFDMSFHDGALHLSKQISAHGLNFPIDCLFTSLAEALGKKAIGIVLSGTGSDGTLGARAIKNAGGTVMVQTPASAEYSAMPQSASTNTAVDLELLPSEMPAKLFEIGSNPSLLSKIDNNDLLQKIFLLLKNKTSHDFSKYKPNSIYRRIQRRLSLQKIHTLSAYVSYLEKTPGELDGLFNDLLIGVTSFFRDPEAFTALEELIVQNLLKDREAGSTIRIWVAGCSTGEEAYSIGMLLMEQMAITGKYFKLLIFASDIDPRAIATARRGIYPADISDNVSKARLKHFFIHESKHYQIKKELRDLFIFSLHDINRDPPFSKLDLMSCRNLLIYFSPELQKKLLPIFHHALNPDGILFLGMSESTGSYEDLFSVIDHKAKLYLSIKCSDRTYNQQLLPKKNLSGLRTNHFEKMFEIPQKKSLRDLTEQTLLREFFPAAVLVNDQGDILYLRGSTGKFLEPAQGDAGVSNILMMAREGLRYSLEMILNKAVKTKETSSIEKLHVKTSDQFTEVDLTIFPVSIDPDHSSSSWLYLILLVEVTQTDKTPKNTNAEIIRLHKELKSRDEHIFDLHKELENFSSDQRCIHEEMQSVNEEFQSTNEELETSREELQSLNEELSTINTELQVNLSGLSRVNNDMNNFISGTGIGTVFVDRQLHILRFTPAVAKIINLIKTDIGRPVTDIATCLVDYNKMAQETQQVLDSLIPCEVEVLTIEGLHYLMRIQPYRTLEHVIEGAVISFIDITEQKKLEVALQEANALLRLAVRDAQDLNSDNLKS